MRIRAEEISDDNKFRESIAAARFISRFHPFVTCRAPEVSRDTMKACFFDFNNIASRLTTYCYDLFKKYYKKKILFKCIDNDVLYSF